MSSDLSNYFSRFSSLVAAPAEISRPENFAPSNFTLNKRRKRPEKEEITKEIEPPVKRSNKSTKEFADLKFGVREISSSTPQKSSAISNLRSIEKFQEKIKEIRQVDPSKAEKILNERAIRHAIEKASGEKVKDKKELLKKTIKKQQKAKEKSRKEWSERIAEQQRDGKDRRDKRAQNIRDKKNKIKKSKSNKFREEK